jgi:hypothetical protein
MRRRRDAPVPRPLCYLRSLLQLLGCYPAKGLLECTQTCLGLCDIAFSLVSPRILGLISHRIAQSERSNGILFHSSERRAKVAGLKAAYLMASGLFPRFARMHGCPALAQFKHDGVSSSHLIFCERHRAQAVPFLRPPPGCCFWRGAGAASAVMPRSASINDFLRNSLEQKAQRLSSMSDWRGKAVAHCTTS